MHDGQFTGYEASDARGEERAWQPGGAGAAGDVAGGDGLGVGAGIAASQLTLVKKSHAVGDKVEAAYRRGDLFEKRAQLMKEWAAYCGTIQKPAKGSNVVAMRGKR